MLSEASLKDLSTQQVDRAGRILEDIFLHEKRDLTLFQEDIELVLRIFRTGLKEKLKQAMLLAFNTNGQMALFNALNEEEQTALFEQSNDSVFQEKIFQWASHTLQMAWLKWIYTHDKTQYMVLKNRIPQSTLFGAVSVDSIQESPEMLAQEVAKILDWVCDSKVPQDKLTKYGKACSKKYTPDVLHSLIEQVTDEFMAMNMALRNQETFLVYLKFLGFMDPYLLQNPELVVKLSPLFEKVIIALKSFPNGGLVVKILNQFPSNSLITLIKRLAGYERIGNFEKRNIYCKLLNEIKHNSGIQEGQYVRFALSQI
jgi:hypothetical protein